MVGFTEDNEINGKNVFAEHSTDDFFNFIREYNSVIGTIGFLFSQLARLNPTIQFSFSNSSIHLLVSAMNTMAVPLSFRQDNAGNLVEGEVLSEIYVQFTTLEDEIKLASPYSLPIVVGIRTMIMALPQLPVEYFVYEDKKTLRKVVETLLAVGLSLYEVKFVIQMLVPSSIAHPMLLEMNLVAFKLAEVLSKMRSYEGSNQGQPNCLTEARRYLCNLSLPPGQSPCLEDILSDPIPRDEGNSLVDNLQNFFQPVQRKFLGE